MIYGSYAHRTPPEINGGGGSAGAGAALWAFNGSETFREEHCWLPISAETQMVAAAYGQLAGISGRKCDSGIWRSLMKQKWSSTVRTASATHSLPSERDSASDSSRLKCGSCRPFVLPEPTLQALVDAHV